jgi:hypothetical protein
VVGEKKKGSLNDEFLVFGKETEKTKKTAHMQILNFWEGRNYKKSQFRKAQDRIHRGWILHITTKPLS